MWSNAERELRAFGRVRLDQSGQPGPIEVLAEREDAELEDLEITEDGTTAVLEWNVAGRSELSFLDLATLQETPGPQLTAEVVASLDLSDDGRLVAMALIGAASPMNVWVLDRKDGKLRQVTDAPHPGVSLESLVRPELVRFPAHDGLELTGWLYLPPQFERPGPAVLNFHGGPEAQERPFFNSTFQALLSQGVAVLSPNVRGSEGFGKTFVNLDNGALRVNAVRDILSCVDHLVHSGISEAGRIGIMGGSYGGFMTTAGLTTYPELFGAGATICGMVNFERASTVTPTPRSKCCGTFLPITK
jgi:dipeptidyl aminopeptidase/acylaminoacyl peptidase